KASAGHYKKAGVAAGRALRELRLADDDSWPAVAKGSAAEGSDSDAGGASEVQVGDELDVSLFAAGQMVDVTGRSIGKGFAGPIKHHRFRAQRATHGNSKALREPGAIGKNHSSCHVFKGKKMAG